MREWLRDTHGAGFELFRHFLLRFFDSDVVTAPGQATGALIGAVAIFTPWFPVIVGPLRQKYAYVSSLPTPDLYRAAVRADELWLITLMMSAIGLLTAAKWQSLFPAIADYRALGALPLRAWQMFGAKLLAMLVVVTAAVVILNLFPALMFPAVSSSRWAFRPALGPRLAAHAAASVAACYFAFFALIALQGLLLNLFRPRAFARITGTVQGLAAGTMLVLIVLSFSIQPQVTGVVLRPELARWLPPVWFLGLRQTMSGDPDAAMRVLAVHAQWALGAAIALALATYTISYQRHRKLFVEGAAVRGSGRGAGGTAILDWLIPSPRRQAVIAFLARTLATSGQHRMVLMAYGGFGVAIYLSGMIGISKMVDPDRVATAHFVCGHVIVLVFLLLGARHSFSIPMELNANWIFQITERDEGRREWRRGMDCLMLFSGAIALIVLPFPLEIRLLGWPRALAEAVLFAAFALLCYEAAFSTWEKLPFTCSYLAGKTPMWTRSLQLFALLGLFPVVNGLLLASLYHPIAYIAALAAMLTAWWYVHASRKSAWESLRLRYEEDVDPAVHSLNLLR